MITTIPSEILTKWQNIADLIAKIINVPAALIMQANEGYMEVSVSSRTNNNPYNVGNREKWHGLYCETAIKSQQALLIPNALKDKNWDKNPHIKLGMIAYLGYPINYPDKTPFGTICVLDSKENNFSELNSNLLLQFRDVIENDLMQLLTLDTSTKEHCKTILKQHDQLKDVNKNLEEKIKKLSAKEKELKLTTTKLEDNEMKLNAILDHRFQLTGLIGTNGRLLVINRTACEMIGADKADLIGQYFWDCPWWNSSTKPKLQSEIKRAARGEFVQFETTHINVSGEVRNIDFSISPIKDNKGKITFLVPEGRDITERKRAENALLTSENKFTKVFNSSPLPVSITTFPEGKHIDVNPRYEKVTGYKKEEILGKSTQELGFYVNPDDQKIILQKLQKEGRLINIEVTFRIKSGQHRFCRLFSEIIEIQNQPCLVNLIYDDTDRKKAENSKSESKKRFKNLVEMLPEVVFETDKNFNLTYVNKRALDIFGYSSEDFSKGINSIEIIALEDRTRAKKNLALRANGISLGKTEYQAVKKDGSTFPIRLHADSIIENGKMEGVLGIIIDLSDSKKAESELLESENMFRTLFESTSDGILILKDNRIVECNSKALSILGFDDKNKMIGLTPSDLSPNKQPDGINTKNQITKNIFKISKGKPQRFNWKHNRKDGTIVDTEVSLNPIVLRNETHVQVVVRDITDRIQAEIKLRESEARFKSLYDELGDAVYVTTFGGKNIGQVLEANKAAVRQTGYTRSELLNMNIIKDLYVPGTGKLSTQEWKDKIDEGNLTTSIEKKRRKDGTEYWTEVLITSISFKGEKACLSINRDITSRVKAEQDLKKALQKATESDRLKSAFLASMSHEIRTPLNAIIGFSNIIAESANNPQLKEFSNLIKNQNNILLNLVNDILDFAKVESGAMDIENANFDLNNLINDLHHTFYSEKQPAVEMIRQKISGQIIVYSDQERLRQVFSNLITNAIKFTAEGSITFGYELNSISEIRCFVKDTGTGIPKDKQESIFDRFVKLDSFSQGTGLGLAIAKNTVKLLGGTMWVESEPGKGSSFYFTIPRIIMEKETNIVELNKKPGSENDATETEKRYTILIVEDDLANFLYIKELITIQNINVVHVSNGLKAVEYVKKNDKIDLILMDIKMPVMDGYKATKLIKKIKPQLPIIALSAYAMPEDELKAKEAGCNDYIPKPINKTKLFELIDKQIDK